MPSGADPVDMHLGSAPPSALGAGLIGRLTASLSANSARTRDWLVVVLTFLTGATDAVGFVKLGGVFTSVMTGNMVFLGIAAGRQELSLAAHAGCALVGFILGGVLGTHVSHRASNPRGVWPTQFARALRFEMAIFATFAVIWEVVGARPTGNLTFLLIAINAVALGAQSGAILSLGVSGLSTTYLTGTLTSVVASLIKRQPSSNLGRGIGTLAALIGGAAVGAAVSVHAPRFVPVLLLGLIASVIVVGGRTIENLLN